MRRTSSDVLEDCSKQSLALSSTFLLSETGSLFLELCRNKPLSWAMMYLFKACDDSSWNCSTIDSTKLFFNGCLEHEFMYQGFHRCAGGAMSGASPASLDFVPFFTLIAHHNWRQYQHGVILCIAMDMHFNTRNRLVCS